MYSYISDVASYEEGIRILKALYIKPTNTVINRYKLSTMKQKPGESGEDTYAYLDDVIICGRTAEEYDTNLKNFMKIAKLLNLTLNMDYSSRIICVLR